MQRGYQLIGGIAVLCIVGGAIAANRSGRKTLAPPAKTRQQTAQMRARTLVPPAIASIKAPNPIAAQIVASAKKQVGTAYDPTYVKLAYPNGDVARDRGVCTDVIVRALRSTNHDLQRLIHEDMKSHFALYPGNWGLQRPDFNIDHRRVPNQMRFFERHGRVLTKAVSSHTIHAWQPGDIVCWRLPNGLYHTGIVADHVNDQGVPLVIHNLSICVEEDCLKSWKVIGHYRYPVAPVRSAPSR